MDGKFSWRFLIGLLIPILVLVGLSTTYPLGSFAVIAAIFLFLLPILDRLSGRDKLHAYDAVCVQKNEPIPSAFDGRLIPLYIGICLQLVAIALGLYRVSTEGIKWLPYFLLVGYAAGVPLTIAHELYHTKKKLQTLISRFATVPSFWGHEEITHLYIHHRDETACLPNDGALSHLGQSLYAYIYQMVTVNLKEAWGIQKELLRNNKMHLISIHNEMLVAVMLSIIITIAITIFLGWLAGLFFIGQAAMAIFVWGLATYIQHYGLVRRKKSDGNYEEFNYMNVWSTNSRLGNSLYFNLFKHAHHHAFIFCPYTELKLIENSPIHPACLYHTLLAALIPPLWYKMMDKEVVKVLKRRDELEAQGLL